MTQEGAMDLVAREQRLLAIIEAAAKNDSRMPTTEELRDVGVRAPDRLLSNLTAKGYIRREVGLSNWRVVFIEKGEHAGRHTAMPTEKWKPYLVISAHGTQKIGAKGTHVFVSAKRDAPPVSLPRISILERKD